MITTRNLCKSFGTICAVNEVNLHIEKQEIYGLVGPDGAGKTTLMRMICGLINPDKGEIYLMGSPLAQIESARENLGYMPQRFSLYGDLTVLENINFFASLYNVDKQTLRARTEEILFLTRILPFKNRFADQLSGGMKQKLALSCALITRPDILVLDEPTYGVDPESRREFWKILYQLNQEGMTIFVSTPYMDEAELCSRVAFINNGYIKTTAAPSSLKKNFPYHVLELQLKERQVDWIKSIPGIIDVSFFGYKYRFIVKDTESASAFIRQQCQLSAETDISPLEIPPTMEDIYIILAEQEAE